MNFDEIYPDGECQDSNDEGLLHLPGTCIACTICANTTTWMATATVKPDDEEPRIFEYGICGSTCLKELRDQFKDQPVFYLG